jgi:hypothetical protein
MQDKWKCLCHTFLNEPQLFNGDFVDRGSFSVECIFTLFGFKLLYPEHFFMSRGKLLSYGVCVRAWLSWYVTFLCSMHVCRWHWLLQEFGSLMCCIGHLTSSPQRAYSAYFSLVISLYADLHLVLRLRLSGAILLLPLYALMACTGTALPPPLFFWRGVFPSVWIYFCVNSIQ